MTTATLTEMQFVIDYAVQNLAELDINCPVCPDLTDKDEVNLYMMKIHEAIQEEGPSAWEGEQCYYFKIILEACLDALLA